MARSARSHAFLAFLGFLAFIIYGSLLPFELRDLSFADAVDRFYHIRFLDLGIVSRADWIANILLYIPLAFLGCNWIAGTNVVNVPRAFGIGFIVVFCLGVAVAIEFTQLFFGPRTVSLNDLLAETIGTILGVLLWVFGRNRLATLWQAFLNGGRASVLAAVMLYALFYLLLSLFPYDFVISAAELKAKLSSGSLGWIVAGECANGPRCAISLTIELLAIAPIGVLLALASPHLSLKRLFVAGVALGIVLELLQLPLATGISQGISVLLRGVGLAAGAVLGNTIRGTTPDLIARQVWRLSLIAAPFYVLAVAAVNGWFSGSWNSASAGLASLANTRLMPFYYHYFTTETVAVTSLLAQAAIYTPVGIAVWANYTSRPYRGGPRYLTTALLAAFLALPIELGKSFIPNTHPDFTNLLIAALGAVIACWLAGWVYSILVGAHPEGATAEKPMEADESTESVATEAVSDGLPLRPMGVLISVVAGLAALVGILSYPVGAVLLMLTAAAYSALLYRRPWLWLLVLPSVLPVLDLSPITGRLLLDEFDILVLVTLVVGYCRWYSLPARTWANPLLPTAFWLLWATWFFATARGLWPLLNMPGGMMVSSHSPLDAWYTGKGLLWALLLVPLMRRIPDALSEACHRLLLNGLVTGLGLLCGVVLWERHVFVGLADFQTIFRVTGGFSSMHTGGAYIEAYIAFAFPALLVWVLQQKLWLWRLSGILLVTVAAYTMLVTFSRGGYAALASGLVVVGLTVWRWQGASLGRRALVMAAMMVGVTVVAMPVLTGDFARSRLAQTADDFEFRLAHWGQALKLTDGGLLTAMVGMGFGRYPTQYLYNAYVDQTPGNYSLLRENEVVFLRLGAGDSVYLDQWVAVEPGRQYQLSAVIRQPFGSAELKVPLCEKALLTSFDCQWYQVESEAGGTPDDWHTVTLPVNSGSLGGGGHWPHRPVKLSLYNPGTENPIDISFVSLQSSDGLEMLANGSFDDGVKRWLFVTDRDLAWHIHQQEIEMYFAQGLLGLLAMVVLLVAVARCLWPALREGDPYATAVSGALVAFLTVGLLGSNMDTARLALLFYLGALAGGLLTKRYRISR
jgi:VanZ family protein/O-antigen ligase